MKELQSQAALFEVTVPEYALIAQCRLENKMLKQMWDYIFLVRWEKKTPQTIIFGQKMQISAILSIMAVCYSWCLCWSRAICYFHQDIDWGVEDDSVVQHWRGEHGHGVQEVCQGDLCHLLFVVAYPTQDVRGFDKTMRPWHAYQGLVIFVKNMSIYL